MHGLLGLLICEILKVVKGQEVIVAVEYLLKKLAEEKRRTVLKAHSFTGVVLL